MTDFVNATGALPPGQAVPPISGLFDEAFHSTDPSQMDMTQPVRFVLVKAGPRRVQVVLQCAVKDSAAYLSALDPGFKKGEEKDGVTTCTKDQETMALGQSGKMICVGEDAAAIGQVLALVKSDTLPQTAMLQGGDVVASLELKELLDHMADEKGGVLGDLKESMKKMLAAAPGGPGQGEQVQRMIEAEVDALETVLKQVDRVTVSLTPDAQDLKLSARLVPVQGSLLAAYLASVPSGIPATLKYMPEDAFAVCSFKIGNLEPLTAQLVEFSTKIMAAAVTDPAQAAQVTAQSTAWIKALGDDMCFAMRSGQSLRAVYAATLKDPEAFKALLQKMPELFDALAGFYRNMGMPMKVQSEAVKYNDREITQLTWTF